MVSKGPVGPAETYAPSTGVHLAELGDHTRILRLDEIPDRDQKRVKQAILRQKPEVLPAADVNELNHSGRDWYCFNNAERDFMVAAQNNADCTNRPQTVHMHAFGANCGGREHRTVTPDPVRVKAVGGLERGRTSL